MYLRLIYTFCVSLYISVPLSVSVCYSTLYIVQTEINIQAFTKYGVVKKLDINE